jgi:5-methylcytosine-specific restriction endonuclease McrA
LPARALRCPDCQVTWDSRRKAGAVTRNPRYANGHRRRLLRAQVLREEDLCHICGRPVDKDLPYLDPWSPVIDEIIPVSKGGNPYDRDNVRLSHRRCNARRGNGTRQHPVIVPYVSRRQWIV